MPSDFTTSVNWGDGTISSNAVWELDNSGGLSSAGWYQGNRYRLLASHTYVNQGNYEVRVDVAPTNSQLREDGNYNYPQHRGFSITQVNVVQQTLTVQPSMINAVDDQPWSGVVATFRDSTLGTDVGDYVATTQWGEVNYGYEYGNQGTIESLGNGNFAVRGSYTYATEANPKVTITINRIEGPSIATATTAKVHGAKPIFVSAGVTLDRVELTSVTLDQSDSYSDNYDENGNYINSNDGMTVPTDFVVSFDWGDGTPLTSAEWAQDFWNWGYGNSFTPYRLLGTHTYATHDQRSR